MPPRPPRPGTARLIPNSNLRIRLVFLSMRVISGISGKECRQNHLCNQSEGQMMQTVQLELPKARPTRSARLQLAFSPANNVVNGFDSRPTCEANTFAEGIRGLAVPN